MYRITIEEYDQGPFENGAAIPPTTKRYEQSVEVIDLRRVIDAINFRPRIYTKRKERSPA